jgi:hypothetical protein
MFCFQKHPTLFFNVITIEYHEKRMKVKNKNGWSLMLGNALKASLSQNKCHWTLPWANTYFGNAPFLGHYPIFFV